MMIKASTLEYTENPHKQINTYFWLWPPTGAQAGSHQNPAPLEHTLKDVKKGIKNAAGKQLKPVGTEQDISQKPLQRLRAESVEKVEKWNNTFTLPMLQEYWKNCEYPQKLHLLHLTPCNILRETLVLLRLVKRNTVLHWTSPPHV